MIIIKYGYLKLYLHFYKINAIFISFLINNNKSINQTNNFKLIYIFYIFFINYDLLILK